MQSRGCDPLTSADAIGVTLPPDGGINADEKAILDSAREVAETILGPNAQESDQMSGPNQDNFDALGRAGLLGLGIPREYGGLNASAVLQREYIRLLSSYCGVTTFIQAQHNGSSRMISNGPNAALKHNLLPDLAYGQRLCAISFAHLRRPGPPVLSATPVEGGYRLNGKAPWVTGWGLMDQVVFGATLPDGRFVYLWSPGNRDDFQDVFADVDLPCGGGGSLHASNPIELCAMNASSTVELTVEDWYIPQAHWLSESDRETMRRNDRNGVLNATSMPLGCAAASVRLLCSTAEKRKIESVQRAAESLGKEWEELRIQIDTWADRGSEPESFVKGVKIRAWCIEFSVRAAHAAITASSGAANLLTHPAQRLLREAMFYTIQAQTSEVMEATLNRLTAARVESRDSVSG